MRAVDAANDSGQDFDGIPPQPTNRTDTAPMAEPDTLPFSVPTLNTGSELQDADMVSGADVLTPMLSVAEPGVPATTALPVANTLTPSVPVTVIEPAGNDRPTTIVLPLVGLNCVDRFALRTSD